MTTDDETYTVFFSGGKDSMLALDRSIREGRKIATLVTLYDEASQRVRFHGVPISLMRAQSEALGIPIALYPTTPATFEQVYMAALADLCRDGVRGLIFGDIHLADVRAWYEDRARAAALAHLEPLWGETPMSLAAEVVARGYEAIITCVEDKTADQRWLGQRLDAPLLNTFAAAGIDICGEHGEYHTFVVDGPLFKRRINISLGGIHAENGFHQIDVQPTGH